MKRALLVDTNFSAAPIAAALSGDGFKVCTVGARPSDSLALAHSDYIQADYSLPGTLESVIDQYGIDLLVPGCNDVSYEVCCEVANKLGLEGFEIGASLQKLHRKDQFRSLCEALSIPAPKTYATVEEGLMAPGSLMIKPIDAYSGKGVQVLRQPTRVSIQDALNTASLASSRGTALIEDFVEGQLYSYSAFLEAGRVQAAFNVIEFGSVNPFVVDTSYVLAGHRFESELKANVETLAAALSIGRGLIHLQYIASESQYWLIEPTRRCPGDLYSELIKRSTGYPYAEAYASAFVGGDLPKPDQVKPEYTIRHTLAAESEGVLDHVQCLNGAQLTAWYSLASSGARLTPSPGGRVAVAFFTAGSEGERYSLVEDLRAGRVLKIQFRDNIDGH